MTLVCITNDIHDLRPCTVKGEHHANCDGFEWHWNRDDLRHERAAETITWSFATRKHERTDKACTGCMPRPAGHGMLCWSCWKKVEEALSIAYDMMTHLRSIARAQQQDTSGVRTASGWVIPVPNTWRMADELLMLIGGPTEGFPSTANVFEVDAIAERYLDEIDPDLWVAREAGAEDAVRFAQLMQSAMAQHPMAEYAHRITNIRCPKCSLRTLLWKPPLSFEGEISIDCQNPRCTAEPITQSDYDELSVLQPLQEKDAARAARKAKKETPAS